jgi:hypothetical protein
MAHSKKKERKIKDLLRHTDDSFSYSNCMYTSIYTHLSQSYKAAGSGSEFIWENDWMR